MRNLQVGIDFHRDKVDFAMTQPDGALIDDHIPFANTLPGFQKAKDLLLQTLKEQGLEGIDIAGEATSLYWLPYFIHLAQDSDLAQFTPRLFLLNARWVRKYKESFSPNHKDDQTDPQVIAAYLLAHHPQVTWKFDKKWLPMRFYTRLRFHLARSLAREKNLLDLHLFLAYSTYSRRKVFSDTLAKASQKLLNNPELMQDLGELDVDRLQKALEDMNEGRLVEPVRNAKRLYKVLEESFPLDEVLHQPIHDALGLLIETINHLEDQIAQVEKWMEALVRSGHYPEIEWLDSIPGIGLVFASGIAAEIGDLERFIEIHKWDRKRKIYRSRSSSELVDAVAKYAGLWWPKNKSGQFEAEERHMSREGSAYLRYYLIEAANSLRQHLPSFAAYYQKKHDQAIKHKHNRAVVLTACKALDLFVALLRRKESYQDKEAARQAKP
jgi:transposase